jgi:TetR/AcrR family fatty acid metabolism transcriptional regulator
VAEVARRAGVSKGVVTYHFPARDDLIWAVISDVFASIAQHVGSRLSAAAPSTIVATYIDAWVDYYRTHRRPMTAIVEIWTNFRDNNGRSHLGVRTLSNELALLEDALAAGQSEGRLTSFSPRVMAVTLKAALDGLLAQLALEPELDLDAYAAELQSLFQRATTAPTPSRIRDGARPKTTKQIRQREETDT